MAEKFTRYYFGSLRLWREGIAHIETDEMGETEEHHGGYRQAALVVQDSPNWSLGLEVSCLGAPHPSSKDQKGWRATYRAMREVLRARSRTASPVVWVEDESSLKTVGSYASATVTCTGHGFSTGDVVLIRRDGAAYWSLATVTVVNANSFTVAAVAGTSLHAIAAADEILLVEGYYLAMFFRGLSPAPFSGKGDWWAKELAYRFKGSGSTTYERTTTATVGT